ncbi:MAG TPA: hypothetical protein VNO55_06210, partial [Polyangia bacterium]|nr:hypothetical protein [Polyangia bacterium]
PPSGPMLAAVVAPVAAGQVQPAGGSKRPGARLQGHRFVGSVVTASIGADGGGDAALATSGLAGTLDVSAAAPPGSGVAGAPFPSG